MQRQGATYKSVGWLLVLLIGGLLVGGTVIRLSLGDLPVVSALEEASGGELLLLDAQRPPAATGAATACVSALLAAGPNAPRPAVWVTDAATTAGTPATAVSACTN